VSCCGEENCRELNALWPSEIFFFFFTMWLATEKVSVAHD